MARVSMVPSISGTLFKQALFLTFSLVVSVSVGHDFLSRECLENAPNLNSSSGAGSMVTIGDLKAYVSGDSKSKKAIILASDIYGHEAPHLRMIADKVATAGFYVVVPDFFYGDPYVINTSEIEWLKSHGPNKGFEDALPLIAALKKQGIVSIGAAGFCWGGKVVVRLASTPDIQATVLLHPTNATVDDIKAVKYPISILAAETDYRTPPELLKQFQKTLTANHIENFVKIFPNVKHGWTVRYNDTDAAGVKAANESHQDLLNWFTKYIKA